MAKSLKLQVRDNGTSLAALRINDNNMTLIMSYLKYSVGARGMGKTSYHKGNM